MPDRRCCCSNGCYMFSDNFNRGDPEGTGEPVGGDWSAESGTWQIDYWMLTETTGTSGSRIMGTGQVSADSAGAMDVQCEFVDPAVGEIYCLYAAWKDDADGLGNAAYYKTEHEFGSGSYTTRLYKGSGGSESLIDTFVQTDITDFAELGEAARYLGWICVDNEGNVKCGLSNIDDGYLWVLAQGGTDGRKYGIGHKNSVQCYFDDFNVYELIHANVLCSPCWCPCCTHLVQKEVTATLTNATGRVSCFEGQSGTLTWEWDTGLEPWKGTINGSGGAVFNLQLKCDQTEDPDCTGQNWTLNIISGCATGIGIGDDFKPISSSTCEPFRLVFGPFTVSVWDLDCSPCGNEPGEGEEGTFYIEITD